MSNLFTLMPEEYLLSKSNKHIIVLYGQILALSAAFLVLLFILLFLGNFHTVYLIAFAWGYIGILATLIYDYQKTILLVTNKRIIFITTAGFFAQQTVDLPFDKIQNIVVNQVGPTDWEIGDLLVETSTGSTSQKEFGFIKSPEKIKELAFGAMHQVPQQTGESVQNLPYFGISIETVLIISFYMLMGLMLFYFVFVNITIPEFQGLYEEGQNIISNFDPYSY